MKIGILTFHYSSNYGAVLQAYALHRVLTARGHSAEIVDYRPSAAIEVYRTEHQLLRWGSRLPRVNWKFYRGRARLAKCQRFLAREARLSEPEILSEHRLPEVLGRYDCVFYGSDEIWSLSSFRGFNAVYFGEGCPDGVRKVSYAATMSQTKTFHPHLERVKYLLGRFSHLSVRDRFTCETLRAECGLESTVVVDPTLLCDFEQESQPEAVRPYVAVPLVKRDLDAHELRYLTAVAARARADIVFLPPPGSKHGPAFCGSPREWLGLIRGAVFVATDSFHGSLFAARYHVPFVIFAREKGLAKCDDFVERFQLHGRVLVAADGDSSPALHHALEVDFGGFSQALESHRQASQDFLTLALGYDSGQKVRPH